MRAFDMEEFVANRIAASTQYPALAKQYADKWSKLTFPQRAQLLNETILRITYDHENKDVGICFHEKALGNEAKPS